MPGGYPCGPHCCNPAPNVDLCDTDNQDAFLAAIVNDIGISVAGYFDVTCTGGPPTVPPPTPGDRWRCDPNASNINGQYPDVTLWDTNNGESSFGTDPATAIYCYVQGRHNYYSALGEWLKQWDYESWQYHVVNGWEKTDEGYNRLTGFEIDITIMALDSAPLEQRMFIDIRFLYDTWSSLAGAQTTSCRYGEEATHLNWANGIPYTSGPEEWYDPFAYTVINIPTDLPSYEICADEPVAADSSAVVIPPTP